MSINGSESWLKYTKLFQVIHQVYCGTYCRLLCFLPPVDFFEIQVHFALSLSIPFEQHFDLVWSYYKLKSLECLSLHTYFILNQVLVYCYFGNDGINSFILFGTHAPHYTKPPPH